MDLNELKNKWQTMTVNLSALERDNRRLAAELARGKVRSAQQKLARFFIVNANVGFLLPVLSVSLLVELHFPVWLVVLYALFGVIMGSSNLSLGVTIKHTNYAGMPVVTALSALLRIRRRILYTRIFGVSVAVIILLSMASEIAGMDDKWLFPSFLIGIVCGVALGFRLYLKSKRLMDELREQVKSCISED